MAKRFTDTEKWKDDWYLSLSNDYRIVWQWLLDNCNHAGICKPSIKLLNFMCNTNLSEDELFKIFDNRLLNFNTYWFIPKFIKFQYVSLDTKKPAVISVVKELKMNNLLNYVSDLFNDFKTIIESLPNDYLIIKDKDKDTDKDKDMDKVIVFKGKNFLNSDFGELPIHFLNSIKSQFEILKKKKIDEDIIFKMWDAFKLENLTGVKFYNSEDEVYKHFSNWLKVQKFTETKIDPIYEYYNRFDSDING
jgi:hypothetical protein